MSSNRKELLKQAGEFKRKKQETKELEKYMRKLNDKDFTIWIEDWFFGQPGRFREELIKLLRKSDKVLEDKLSNYIIDEQMTTKMAGSLERPNS